MALEKLKVIRSHTAFRGIAALAVLLHHLQDWGFSKPFNKSFYSLLSCWQENAVILFFYLSGFILFYVYVSAQEINWKGFFRSRLARILPLYYITLVTVMYLSNHRINSFAESWRLATNITLLSGLCEGPAGCLNFPSWSVGIELMCYACIFPLLVTINGMIKIYGSIIIIIITTALLILNQTCGSIFIFFGWDSTWLVRGIMGFTGGFMIAKTFKKFQNAKKNESISNIVMPFCIILFGLFAAQILNQRYFPLIFPFLLYFSASDTGISKCFQKPIMQWLGERSYSIYLWQFPALLIILKNNSKLQVLQSKPFLKFSVIMLLVLALAEISYRFIEMPIRELLRVKTRDNIARPLMHAWKNFIQSEKRRYL